MVCLGMLKNFVIPISLIYRVINKLKKSVLGQFIPVGRAAHTAEKKFMLCACNYKGHWFSFKEEWKLWLPNLPKQFSLYYSPRKNVAFTACILSYLINHYSLYGTNFSSIKSYHLTASRENIWHLNEYNRERSNHYRLWWIYK